MHETRRGEAWLPGILVAQTGPVSFIVELMQGGLVRKHQDKVRMRFASHCILKETPLAPPPQETQLLCSIPHLPAPRDTSNMSDTDVICSPAATTSTSTSTEHPRELPRVLRVMRQFWSVTRLRARLLC